MRFYNSTSKDMNLDDVVIKVLDFIRKEPINVYRLAIGTDSQVIENKTCFVTGIHIHRVGKCSWGCICKSVEGRAIRSMREKISKETVLSYELASRLSVMLLDKAYEIVLPFVNKGANVDFEVHIDVGNKGATRVLVKEMIGYFMGLGIETKIKPESYVASSYANKYSKKISGIV